MCQTQNPDTGGSQLLADGKIKLKNDSALLGFTETGLRFEDGSELAADAVVFATGYVKDFFVALVPELMHKI